VKVYSPVEAVLYSGRIKRVLAMVHNTQNRWVYGNWMLYPSSGGTYSVEHIK
jgi:hypothetical protein